MTLAVRDGVRTAAGEPAGFSAGCNVLNVGTTTVTVMPELLKIDGQLQQAVGNFVIAPGQAGGFSQSIGSIADHLWCRFTMVNGSSRNIRASFEVISETTGLAAATLEAR